MYRPADRNPAWYAALRAERLKQAGVTNPQVLIVAYTTARINQLRGSSS